MSLLGMQSTRTGTERQWGKPTENGDRNYWKKVTHFQAECEELMKRLRLGNLKLSMTEAKDERRLTYT